MKELVSMGLIRDGRGLRILDQTLLPQKKVWVTVASSEEMIGLIKRLAVRGAPLIGVAAALSLAEESEKYSASELGIRLQNLREARPTAVNLMWAMDRMKAVLEGRGVGALREEAERVFLEDVELCKEMAKVAFPLFPRNGSVLTICNTGGLATAGIGTALGAIRHAVEEGKVIHVYALETRPLGQGARLTAWELENLKIPFTLVTDSVAAFLMKKRKIDGVFVGADRVALNGDSANKIGTYGLAIAAQYHGTPFYVVAPSSTFDSKCAAGIDIPIEERSMEEVRFPFAGSDTPVWNPAFDVTPHQLITGIVSEKKIHRPGLLGLE